MKNKTDEQDRNSVTFVYFFCFFNTLFYNETIKNMENSMQNRFHEKLLWLTIIIWCSMSSCSLKTFLTTFYEIISVYKRCLLIEFNDKFIERKKEKELVG